MSRCGWFPSYALTIFLAAAPAALAQDAQPSPQRRTAKLIAVLKSDAPLEQKYEVCRQLAVVGDPRATPALADLLADPKLSHMARYALEPISDPAADKALRDALGRLKDELLIGVIHSIGVRQDGKAVGALAKLLKGSDAAVAAAAAGALGRIATPKAAETLAELRRAAKGALRPAAADASLRAAQRLLRRGRREQALAIYKELRAEQWPPHVRLGAFTGLLAAAPNEAPARITQAAAGSDPLLRATAIAQVPTLDGENVAARFAAELSKMPPDVQVLLIGALSRRPDAKAELRPVVTAAVGSPSADVRLAAVQALGAVGDAASVPVLCAVLDKGKAEAEKQAAAASLRALEGETIDAAILACMKKASPSTRPELIAVLADRKALGAIGELLRQARERDKGIRSAALKALARLAQPKHLPTLIGLLTGLEGDAGRSDAERAIVRVSRKIPEARAQADPSLAALSKATDPATRCSLLRVLGAIADARALQTVQSAAGANDPAVQDTAIRVLAGWPDARPLSTLLGLFRTTSNPTHRVLALRGCVRLLGLGDRPPAEALRIHADLASRAKRVEDKRLVLSGLAKVADPAALEAIEPFLSDPATRDEAELALINVAQVIMGIAPSEAKAVAKRLAAESKSQAVRSRAAKVIRSVERFSDYVTAWQVAGPYERKGKDGSQLIDVAFPPESANAKGVAWRILTTRTQGKQPWMLEFHPLFGGENRACYVRTWVHSDKVQAALLEFGTDDGSKVWLNGKVVHADGAGGAAVPGEHKVPVQLRKGWNALLLKVTQYTGPWQFCFRIRSGKGERLPGLRVHAASPRQ